MGRSRSRNGEGKRGLSGRQVIDRAAPPPEDSKEKYQPTLGKKDQE